MAEFNPIARFKKRPTHLNAIKAMCAAYKEREA